MAAPAQIAGTLREALYFACAFARLSQRLPRLPRAGFGGHAYGYKPTRAHRNLCLTAQCSRGAASVKDLAHAVVAVRARAKDVLPPGAHPTITAHRLVELPRQVEREKSRAWPEADGVRGGLAPPAHDPRLSLLFAARSGGWGSDRAGPFIRTGRVKGLPALLREVERARGIPAPRPVAVPHLSARDGRKIREHERSSSSPRDHRQPQARRALHSILWELRPGRLDRNPGVLFETAPPFAATGRCRQAGRGGEAPDARAVAARPLAAPFSRRRFEARGRRVSHSWRHDEVSASHRLTSPRERHLKSILSWQPGSARRGIFARARAGRDSPSP